MTHAGRATACRASPGRRCDTRHTEVAARVYDRDGRCRGYCPVPPSRTRNNPGQDKRAAACQSFADVLGCTGAEAAGQREPAGGSRWQADTLHSVACGASGQRLGGCGRRLGSRGGCGLELAHRGSTLWPQPRQNHAQPESCEQQEGVEKQVVSHVVPLPSRWRGGISPVFPARQLSVHYRDTTERRRGVATSSILPRVRLSGDRH